MHVAQKSQDHDASFNDDVWLRILDERAMLDQAFVRLVNIRCEVSNFIILLLTLLTERHVDALDAEVAGDSDGTVDIVTEAFE
jgi:hypothetical protein